MGVVTQTCGIVINLFLAFFYLKQRKLHLDTQKAFARVWRLVFIGLVLDMVSILVYRHVDFWGNTFAVIVFHLYLMAILWEQVFGLFYIDAYISEQRAFKRKENRKYFNP